MPAATDSPTSPVVSIPAGIARPAPAHAVVAAVCEAVRSGAPATLALVLDTDGSTYSGAGAMALFGPDDVQLGWLSGGCLEPEIARRAAEVAASGRIGWMEIDTRDDAALMSGSALGCRGRLRLALLPVTRLPGVQAPLQAWLDGDGTAHWTIGRAGTVELETGALKQAWTLDADVPGWTSADTWSLTSAARPQLLLCGGGPETPLLLPLLRDLGWRTTLVESRERWRPLAALADRHRADGVAATLADGPAYDAALVMHHNFELDLDALDALSATQVPFVGLLGPRRRSEDLFRLLPTAPHAALRARLHSPIGLDLGGRGAEAIGLSIAAQLQAWRHGRRP
ncbi:XdhC family protein [Luteimonas sp. WGS1318]|uniref:XdhC family protein n=1 Tax=Luteimonas sp. WGS1318 TaxID=3366815 RepID=UPI00372D65AC